MQVTTINKDTLSKFYEFMGFLEHSKVLKEQGLIANRFTAPSFEDLSAIRKRLSQAMLMRLRNEFVDKFSFNVGGNTIYTHTIKEIKRRQTRSANLLEYFMFTFVIESEHDISNVFISEQYPNAHEDIVVLSDEDRNKFLKELNPSLDGHSKFQDFSCVIKKVGVMPTYAIQRAINTTNSNIPGLTGISSTRRAVCIDLFQNFYKPSYANVFNNTLFIMKYFYGNREIPDSLIYDNRFENNGNKIVNHYTVMDCDAIYIVFGIQNMYNRTASDILSEDIFSRVAEVSPSYVHNLRSFLNSNIGFGEMNFRTHLLSQLGLMDMSDKYVLILKKKTVDENGDLVCHPYSITSKVNSVLRVSKEDIYYADRLTHKIETLKNNLINNR